MKTIGTFHVLVLVLTSVTDGFSQASTNADPRDTRPEYMRNVDVGRTRQNERVKKVVDQSRSVVSSRGNPESPEQRRTAEIEKQEALAEVNRLLSVPPEYGARYAEFLKEKNTGLVRVFPDRGCDKGVVVSVENLERCGGTAPIKGAGSLFSFRLNKLPSYLDLASIHRLIGLSDIHFINGKFSVGTEAIQDAIADVGEVELTDVTLRSDSVKFLKSFKPGKTVAQVALQNQDLRNGIKENGFSYSTSATVMPNRTYVLRSIAYNSTGYRTFWHTDVITAFKVVGQENDGSVVIIWKELKESEAPYLRK
jgi:hypothetical protein